MGGGNGLFGGKGALVEEEGDDGGAEGVVDGDEVDEGFHDEEPALLFVRDKVELQHRRGRLLLTSIQAASEVCG